ncbi:MAG TPA: glycerophosphodiester phosphodiesterase [Candidatus Angelobacter sp.]|jgi:glycerophosphoryl diester phosphodiesterase|nr:glycerophosphodiester phosphodiesterase [Candidatus Angelobacter sp.]
MTSLRWIAHAGLAADRPGGTPTRLTLTGAERLKVDWLEIDVRCPADGTLVLRHDQLLPSRRQLAELSLDAIRSEDPDVLTLDEAVEVLRPSSVPTLVDLKDSRDAAAVARWLAAQPDPDAWAICSDDPEALRRAREIAPKIARWRTLPRVAPGRGEGARRIAACALRSLLSARLPRLVEEVGAAALSVDRYAVTPALSAAAHRLTTPIAAWTVNSPRAARRMNAAGVDLITTDQIERMRAAIGPSQDSAATGRCDE